MQVTRAKLTRGEYDLVYSIRVSNISLQFFTGCDVGYYAENCSDRCDHCKNSASCGIQHGDCDENGCVYPGYQPPLCKGLKRNRDRR